MSGFMGSVTMQPEPKPCSVCGHDTATDGTGFTIFGPPHGQVKQPPGSKPEIFAFLCCCCLGRAVMWAARQSFVDAPAIVGDAK